MEVREFQKNVVLTDRLCYVSSITWSHAYCLAVEKMMEIETPERGQWIRVISLELQRIASHLMWLASYGPDLGLLTGLLWALRARERRGRRPPSPRSLRDVWGDRLRASGVARWRCGGLVRPVRVPLQRVAGVVPDRPASPEEDAEDGSVSGEAPAPRRRRGVRQDGGLPRRGSLLRHRGRG